MPVVDFARKERVVANGHNPFADTHAPKWERIFGEAAFFHPD